MKRAVTRGENARARPRTVAEIVEAVHKGRIGHTDAIDALGLKTYNDLVDTMHANGFALWAHRRGQALSPETLDLLAAACGREPGKPRKAGQDDVPDLGRP